MIDYMKSRLLILFFFLTTTCSFSQNPYLNFVTAFKENFNNQSFGVIHDYTNDAFKAQVTKEQIVQILSAAYINSGKITEVKLADSTATHRVYNLICERG